MVLQNRQRESLSRRKLEFAQVSSPIYGKTFYLDLRKPLLKEKVIKCVRHLGGRIEDFLSKEVDLFITDRPVSVSEQRETTLRNDSSESATSPNCIPLPSLDLPVSNKSTNSSSLFISCPSKPLTRTQTLLLKAQQNYGRSQSQSTSDISSNSTTIQSAISMGIKVMSAVSFLKSFQEESRKLRGNTSLNYPDDIKTASPAHRTNCKPRPEFKENQPCVKVEDCSRKYKPLLKTFDRLPEISYELSLNSRTSNSKKRQKTTPRTVSATPNNSRVGTLSVHRPSTVKGPKYTARGGYCESCDYWYSGKVKEHLAGSRHQQFAKNNDNYKTLDVVISKLPGVDSFLSSFNNKRVDSSSKSTDVEMKESCDIKMSSALTEINLNTKNTDKLCDNFYRNSPVSKRIDAEGKTCSVVMETDDTYIEQPKILRVLLEKCSLLENKDTEKCVNLKPIDSSCVQNVSTPPDDIDGDILNMANSVNMNIGLFDEADEFDRVDIQPPVLEKMDSTNFLPSFISESLPLLEPCVNKPIQTDTHSTKNIPKKKSPRKKLLFGVTEKACENNFSTEIPQCFSFGKIEHEDIIIPSTLPLPFPQIPAVCQFKSGNKNRRRKRRRSRDSVVPEDVYFATKTSEMKLTLSRVPDKTTAPGYNKDLKSYWKVRKAGDCKLVFSPKYSRKSFHRDRSSRRVDGTCNRENEPLSDEPTGKRIKVVL